MKAHLSLQYIYAHPMFMRQMMIMVKKYGVGNFFAISLTELSRNVKRLCDHIFALRTKNQNPPNS